MKITLCAMATLASISFVVPAQAGSHHSNGGTTGASVGRSAPSRFGYRSGAIHGGPVNSRIAYSGYGARGFSQNRVYSNRATFNGAGRFSGRNFANAGSFNSRLNQNRSFSQNRTFSQTGRNFRNGNNLRSNWQNHVFARQSSNWHRDWTRGRDHWWHGHRCAFIGGSWVVFDFGFDPWWDPYWYPYPPYPTGYYPYSYAPPADDYGYGPNQEETPSQQYYRENGK